VVLDVVFMCNTHILKFLTSEPFSQLCLI